MRAAALFLIAAIVFAGVFLGLGIGRHRDPMVCKAEGRVLALSERRERLLRSAYAEQERMWEDFDAFAANGVVVDSTSVDSSTRTFGGVVYVPRYRGSRDTVKLLAYTFDACGNVLERTAMSQQVPGLFNSPETDARWDNTDE